MANYEAYDQYGNKITLVEQVSMVDTAMDMFSWSANKKYGGASAGEQCANCRSNMNEGGSVCPSCRAKRTVRYTGFLSLLLFLVFFPGVLAIVASIFMFFVGNMEGAIQFFILGVVANVVVSVLKRFLKLKTTVIYKRS